MLSVNLLDGARLYADSHYCEEASIEKAVFTDSEIFYATAADKNSAVIDIEIDDGSKYYSIAKGEGDDYRVTVRLDEPIESSYQIKIVTERGLAIYPDFIIT